MKPAPSAEPATTVLFRPVNQAELELVRASGFRRFPPRLPGQPIFYPVLTQQYATEISRQWNVPEYGAGFVLRFRVRSDYLSRHEVHTVGSVAHQEYWIPAADLDDLNDAIVGPIEVISEFRRKPEDR